MRSMLRDARRWRWLVALPVLSGAFVAAGVAALAAVGEGSGGAAAVLAGLAAVLAAAMLATQATTRRLPARHRLAALGLSAGCPGLVAVLASLFAIAMAFVADWSACIAAAALAVGCVLVLLAAFAVYRGGGPEVIPPFEPLRPEVFAANPDPPAYASPPPRVPPPPAGMLDRLLRALWLRR
jgi:hypothetical protein